MLDFGTSTEPSLSFLEWKPILNHRAKRHGLAESAIGQGYPNSDNAEDPNAGTNMAMDNAREIMGHTLISSLALEQTALAPHQNDRSLVGRGNTTRQPTHDRRSITIPRRPESIPEMSIALESGARTRLGAATSGNWEVEDSSSRGL